METCSADLTSESVDEILWWDHSNETSSPVPLHGTVCLLIFHKMKLEIFGTFGSYRVVYSFIFSIQQPNSMTLPTDPTLPTGILLLPGDKNSLISKLTQVSFSQCCSNALAVNVYQAWNETALSITKQFDCKKTKPDFILLFEKYTNGFPLSLNKNSITLAPE